MRYVDPNQSGSKVEFKAQYDNFIGGEWVAPVKGEYFEISLLSTVKFLQKSSLISRRHRTCT